MEPVLYLVILPFVFGLFCFLLPKQTRIAGEASLMIGACLPYGYMVSHFHETYSSAFFLIDNLSCFILLFTGLFGILISLYSLSFMSNSEHRNTFYTYILWTIAGASGALISNNMILLLVFWGFIGLTLYLMIGLGGSGASDVSKKTFIIVGGSDAFLLLGIAILWLLTGTWRMDKITLDLARQPNSLGVIAFLCFLVASFAKAGAMPFHTWIPDCAEKAPVPETALLPASLDKLLGIYLLARSTMNLFVLNQSMQQLMLFSGAVTIVAAVFMAMIQHDMKKLLGYHAVSQVGYMVLGIGTGIPIGIAGGLFHMLNHAIYKSCLFLCGGAVEKKTGTSDLDKLGGLARFMPITFLSFVVAALAISGVPPFNGFASKWMVYQSLVELGRQGHKLWILWLAAAMFGSALTLASFMKLIHAIFLGQKSKHLENRTITEAPFPMLIPMAVLAVLCIIFGVFAGSSALEPFIKPAVKGVAFSGFWEPVLATLFILIGLFLGAIIYFLGRPGAVRESESYVGGEILEKGLEVSGVDFYQTIQDMGFFKRIYKMAEKKYFDIYDQGKNLVFSISRIFQILHTGVLPTYIIWSLLGLLILIIIFLKGGL